MSKSNYSVLALIALNYALEAALLTHVDGFALPPAAIFGIAVLLAPIGPLLGILPQLGVRVPTFTPAEPEPGAHPEPTPLRQVP